MKIVQLIDSLRLGGAEQMAVYYANALSSRIEGSFLCCTRKEGLLKQKLASEVGYFFLSKKNSLDPNAFFKFRSFVKNNEIDIIHAHSSSFFLAVLVKWTLPRLKVVWHDHFGRSLEHRTPAKLKLFSKSMDGIISVNTELEQWAQQHLHSKKVEFIRNFLPEMNSYSDNYILKRENSFKIVCLANLRPQKDHLNMLVAFKKLHSKVSTVSLHFIGLGEDVLYSEEIKKFIWSNNLQEHVFLYGGQLKVEGFLKSADLGILSSVSEGLPLALLEYGKAGLPVVCTNVGQCADVIGEFGKLVSPKKPDELKEAISFYRTHEAERKQDAAGFRKKIITEYSEKSVIPEILKFYDGVICNGVIR